MTRNEVRELIGILRYKRSIEIHIHEIEEMQRTDEAHFCLTVFLFVGILRSIGQIVVAILDIQHETRIDSTDHGIGTGPVGGIQLFCFRIIPDPPSLIGRELVAIPDGTVETGSTGIDILDIRVFTRSLLTNYS